jgi:hypothetical protein
MTRISVTLQCCPSTAKFIANCRVSLNSEIIEEVINWCEEHLGKRYKKWDILVDYEPKYDHNWLFVFLNEEAATWFKLTWG